MPPSSGAASLTSHEATRQPSWAKRRAVALPMPAAPPVTITTLSRSPVSIMTFHHPMQRLTLSQPVHHAAFGITPPRPAPRRTSFRCWFALSHHPRYTGGLPGRPALRADPIRGGILFRFPIPFHYACRPDRKSTRLNSSHLGISYAVFCLKKKH